MIEINELTFRKVVELFEYGKNNERYWNRFKLYKQVVIKALFIADALYPRYSLLFLFDNAIGNFVYIDDAPCITKINKKSEGKLV